MRPYIQIDRREQITTTAAVAADHTVKNGCRAPSLGLGVLLLRHRLLLMLSKSKKNSSRFGLQGYRQGDFCLFCCLHTAETHCQKEEGRH